MTSEQFQQLDVDAQERFILEGGKISLETPPALPAVSQEVVVPDEKQEIGCCQPQPVPEVKTDEAQPLPTSVQSPAMLSDKLGFDIKDPVELLFLLDDDIISGRVSLHPWQIQHMLDFAHECHTKDFPFQAAMPAANGSGKDKYIVASEVVWLCMRYMKSRGVVTNGSGTQLDNQTELYIRFLCERANAKWGNGKKDAIWKCNYRYYECIPTGSPITLFATDEPNKAEGYHPLEPGAKMGIFTSETKGIPDAIFGALERCTGFTHRVDVSTPGLPLGYFFDICSTAVDRKSISDIKSVSPTDFILYKVTAYDCPHISENEIEKLARRIPGGRNSPVFKSAVFAEFGTTDEQVVIPFQFVSRARNKEGLIQYVPDSFNTAGLDLSDGGDETVLIVRNGNKHIATVPFKFDNTEDTILFLNEKFREYNLHNPKSLIFADCGGIGKPMLDRLKRQGWTNIRYVDNRHAAGYKQTYINRGTELWFHTRELMEQGQIIFLYDEVTARQLATRYYKITGKNTHQLLSKPESRSRGFPSPDRADAFVLCFSNYKSTFESGLASVDKPFEEEEEKQEVVSEFSLRSFAGNSRNSYLEVYNVNNGIKNFSTLEDEVADYNKSILLARN